MDHFFYSNCALGKCTKLPFTASSSMASTPLALVHSDVWGPAPVTSFSGYWYYVLFVDDCTKFCWFYPIKTKSEVFQTFLHFKAHVEKLLSLSVKALRSDLGGEFLSTAFVTYLKDHGIDHQLSCPHTPQQNGCADRKHRHLVETARTLLATSKVPQFWVEAFTTAIYLINRLPISSKNYLPFGTFTQKKTILFST